MAGVQACVTAVPQAIDALIAFAEAQVPAGVDVFDGDEPAAPSGDYVIIGIKDPDPDDTAPTAPLAQTTQAWAAVGWQQAVYTDETGVITCAAVAWVGDRQLKVVRDKVSAIVSTLAGAMFDDPTLGLGPWFQARIATFQLTQLSHPDGVTARAVFEVHTVARIMRPA